MAPRIIAYVYGTLSVNQPIQNSLVYRSSGSTDPSCSSYSRSAMTSGYPSRVWGRGGEVSLCSDGDGTAGRRSSHGFGRYRLEHAIMRQLGRVSSLNIVSTVAEASCVGQYARREAQLGKATRERGRSRAGAKGCMIFSCCECSPGRGKQARGSSNNWREPGQPR